MACNDGELNHLLVANTLKQPRHGSCCAVCVLASASACRLGTCQSAACPFRDLLISDCAEHAALRLRARCCKMLLERLASPLPRPLSVSEQYSPSTRGHA